MVYTVSAAYTGAVAAIEQALAQHRSIADPYGEAKALFVYGKLLAAQDEDSSARAKFTEARAICERLGEGLYRPHIERALVRLG